MSGECPVCGLGLAPTDNECDPCGYRRDQDPSANRMVEIECANEEGCETVVGYVSSRWLPTDDTFGLTFPSILCADCGEALMPADDDDAKPSGKEGRT